LSSDGLIPMNQMHLYEFLPCVASEVEDPVARANLIGDVLSNAVETLESPEVQQSVAPVSSLLASFGITQAGDRPERMTDPMNVKNVTTNFNRLFTAMNRLLSDGKHCSGAALKRRGTTTTQNAANQLNFPDEGPVRIQDLAVNDPFVAF
jgi:hypothetical protein